MSLAQNKADLFGGKKTTASSSSTAKPSSTSSSTTSSTANSKPAAAPAPPVSRTANANLMSGSVAAADAKMKQKKIEEAQDNSKKGMEYLKTSMFSWKPDHLAAAPCFEASAECYKAAEQYDNACGMLMKAAESHEAYGSHASAALCLLKAAAIAKQTGDRKKCVTLTLKAAHHFGIHGDLQRYGETLGAAAKDSEDIDAAKALEHYKKAVDVVCPESMSAGNMAQIHPSSLDIFRNASSFCVKNKKLKEALAYFKRLAVIYKAFETESSMCKAMLSITILQLALGDAVLAQNTYLNEHLSNPQYLNSKECEVADLFVLAFNNQDLDMLDKAQRHVQLNYLDKNVMELARGLSLLSFEGESTSETAAAPAEKASLFASNKKKEPTAAAPVQPVVKATPPPPAAVEEEQEDTYEGGDDVGEVNIDDIVIDGENEGEEEGESEYEPHRSNNNYNNNSRNNIDSEEDEAAVYNNNDNNENSNGNGDDEELDLS